VREFKKPRDSPFLALDADGHGRTRRLKNQGALMSVEGHGRGLVPNLKRGEAHSVTMMRDNEEESKAPGRQIFYFHLQNRLALFAV
jgi:hypothetical protein